MTDKRIVMRVSVIWVTDDDSDSVEYAFRAYDDQPIRYPSPVEWVAQALQFGAQHDMSLASPEHAPEAHGFEIRVEGPDKWSEAYEQLQSEADTG